MDVSDSSSKMRANILLVDDQPANLLALEAILEPLGYRLLRASSGQEALRAVLKEQIALILLDVQMPEMDGFEVASVLKSHARTRNIPIIFITALSRDAEHIFRGYKTGAVDFILKPLNPDILRSKVSVFVDLFLMGEQVKQQAALLRQRELEELRQQSEHRFRTLVDAMPLTVFAANPQGHVYYGNRIWREYVGMPAESEADILAGVHPEDSDRVRSAWQQAIGSGESIEIQYRLQRASDQTYRWMLGRVVPERDARGQVLGWIAVAADIDEQKKVEVTLQRLSEQEQRARREAEAASRSKDEFLAMVSHELRTPLTAILGWVSILRKGSISREKLEHALQVIDRNVESQRKLIEDILEISRIVTGKLKLEMKPVNLPDLVAESFEAVRTSAEAKQITLAKQIIGTIPDSFKADPARLKQIVLNLVSNAVKFCSAGANVEVKAWSEGDRILIQVADTGPGIEPEVLPHLFDRFWQADSTSTRQQGGLGLGLAIVRHLIELHGGTVRAESAGRGLGATFTVELPLNAAAVSEPPAKELSLPSLAEPHLEHLRVLLVEDDPDSRDAIASLLREFGAEVQAVASAEEAVRALEALPPDVLLSDIGMAHEDGYSLIRRVRQLLPARGGNVPAAALTAFTSPQDSRRALEAGFQAHMAKPVDSRELISLVNRLVVQHGAIPGDGAPAGTL
jgi:PAS domain S-box-containing protein